VSAVVGAAVPAAVCRWGLCPCCPDVGRCISGVYNHHLGTHILAFITYAKLNGVTLMLSLSRPRYEPFQPTELAKEIPAGHLSLCMHILMHGYMFSFIHVCNEI